MMKGAVNTRDLRVPFVIQVSHNEPDGQGGNTKVWEDFTPIIYGNFMAKPRGSQDQSGSYIMLVYHFVSCRYRPGVLPKMRVKRMPSGVIYMIEGVVNTEERNRFLEMMCSEVGSEEGATSGE
jgi:head-tail adaptor